ncbi:hypothetical protein Mapa_013852 [Marchantia paleacea]|nr:hypothetical protein Mapa_013852 [Marchantia paleacea]
MFYHLDVFVTASVRVDQKDSTSFSLQKQLYSHKAMESDVLIILDAQNDASIARSSLYDLLQLLIMQCNLTAVECM